MTKEYEKVSNLDNFFEPIIDAYVDKVGIDVLIEKVKKIKLDKPHHTYTDGTTFLSMEEWYLLGYLNHYWKKHPDKVPKEEWVVERFTSAENKLSFFSFESDKG